MFRKPILFALVLGALFTAFSFASHTPVNAGGPSRCRVAPPRPTLAYPAEAATVATYSVTLSWNPTPCATTYNVVVKQGFGQGRRVDGMSGLTTTEFKTRPLPSGRPYIWHVKSCNIHGCTKSQKFMFINIQE